MRKLCCALAAMLVMLAFGACAETPGTPVYTCGDYVYVLTEDGSAEIVCWMGAETALEVPGTLDGRTVVGVGENAFENCAELMSVALPDGVAWIGEGAFSGCASLGEVRLGEGLRRIGDLAFADCEALTRLSLPDSVQQVGINPFKGCENLVDLFVSPDHPCLATINGVLFSKQDKRLVCYPGGLMAERYAVPEGVRTVGAMAFDGNLYLESVRMPESLVSMGQEAFCGCQGLRAMNLPAGLQEIGPDALERCSRLALSVAPESYGAQYAMDCGIDCEGGITVA